MMAGKDYCKVWPWSRLGAIGAVRLQLPEVRPSTCIEYLALGCQMMRNTSHSHWYLLNGGDILQLQTIRGFRIVFRREKRCRID